MLLNLRFIKKYIFNNLNFKKMKVILKLFSFLKKSDHTKQKIFILFVTTIFQNCDGCHSTSDSLNEVETISEENNYYTKPNNYFIKNNKEKEDESISKTSDNESFEEIISTEEATDKSKLERALSKFSTSFSSVKLKDEKESIEISQAIKDAVKLGILPKEYETLFRDKNFYSPQKLVENILRLDSESPFLNTTDNNKHPYSKEKLKNIVTLETLRSLSSLQIVEHVIETNKKDIEFPQEDLEVIKTKIQTLKNTFCNEISFSSTEIATPENLRKTLKSLGNLEELLFGNIKPKRIANIDEDSSFYKEIIESKDDSIINHWIKSKALRTGSWQSSLGISSQEDNISNVCQDLIALFEIYKDPITDHNIETLKNQHQDFTKTLEKGEKAIESLRSILNEKDSFIDITDKTEREGLRWVGQWRENGFEKQITQTEAVKLLSFLDWMSASIIVTKHKNILGIPIFGTKTILNKFYDNKLWIKESNEERKIRETEEWASYNATFWTLFIGSLIPFVDIIAFPAFIVFAPFMIYKDVKMVN